MNGTGVADKSAPREKWRNARSIRGTSSTRKSSVEAARKRICISSPTEWGSRLVRDARRDCGVAPRAIDESLTGRREKPTSTSVRAGDQWLQRVELNLKSARSS